MNTKLLITSLTIISAAPTVFADTVDDYVIAEQRAALQENTQGKGFGPQSPRDIDSLTGKNQRVFNTAPAASQMNLCNIHFHKNAEHKGGEFNKYAGNGDGKGNNTGYLYTGKLTKEELKPFNQAQSSLQSGDTIELHYVYTTAQVKPGPTLGSCLSDSVMNPQLRVETQVSVLVNDKNALDFETLTAYSLTNSYYQALNIPNNTGTPIQYAGSTTGPSYNEQGSPLQVTWSVRPQVNKVDIASVEKWLEGNDFKENHAHGVRNLVVNPDLLSSGH
ncbi:delta-class carbonic anhydrase [Vibrio scophthalmi]|uniref:delta-class carbonic anhydrase n=1 Tax=Vibrio scophthalmi TaxID=45658 RepID=UPI003EBAB6E9